jgi:formylglycine-generating enzyme required for sulfatase activity
MAQPDDESRPPRPPMTPGQPLPRLRYAPPPEAAPPDPAPAAPAPRREKSRKADRDEPGQGAGRARKAKTVADEATPNLDTYETRRAIRWVIGGIAFLILALCGWAILGSLRGPRVGPGYEVTDLPPADAPPPSDRPMPPPSKASAAGERDAQAALADARRFAERNNPELARQQLERIVATFPDTKAAGLARAGIDRGDRGLPLFVDGDAMVAQPEAPPPAAIAPEPVVVAARPGGEAPVGATLIAAPAVPPEPRQETGLAPETADVPPRALPEGFRARPGAGVHPVGYPLEITCDRDGGAMVLVPGGTFLMGRDDGPNEERPAHRVALAPYYIDQHEITAGQFARFRAERGRAATDGVVRDFAAPATKVSFAEAQEYAEWAGKRLPTEAQWELAARTVDGRLVPWGTGPPDWQRPRKPGQVDAVMVHRLDLSPYGVFDLAGNVREWTADWFDPSVYARRAASVAVDPSQPEPGRARIPERAIRGGSPEWLATWRAGMRPDARLDTIGFRCVLPLAGAAPAAIAAGGATPDAAESYEGWRGRIPPGHVPF